MTLTLTLTMSGPSDPLSPDLLSLRTRQVRDGAFSFGRAPENDWVLPDPERHLSKRHCVIAWREGYWEATDLSTNGTFLNDDDDPIGLGNVRDLRDGDRLRFGGYEVAVRIAGMERSSSGIARSILASPREAAPPPSPVYQFPNASMRADPLLIEDPCGTDSIFAAVQPDHTPGIEDAFRPPRPIVLLDDEWDLEVSSPSAAESVAPAPVLPASLADDPAVPLPVNAPTPFLHDRAANGDPVSPSPVSDPTLLAAFLRGAGLPEATSADPAATMEALGAMFRAMVSGLRETLIARAAVKDEFRIAQTVIRSRGNNPLKFSASDDDAMLALLGAGRRSEKGAADAVEEALRDIRLHELATMAAMQNAARALLREFNPTKLRNEAGSGGLLAQQRKARAWDAFEALHLRLTEAFSDDFDSAFGRAFARAYEQAQREGGA